MEHNYEKEPCTTNILNKKISYQNKNFKDIQEVTVKKNVNVDDEEDDVDIDEENQMMPANMCLMVENTLCDKKESEWVIDEDSDHSIDEDLDISSSKVYRGDKKINSKTLELDTQKIKNSTSGSKINEPISNIKQTKEESYLSSAKMIKQLQHVTNSTLNDLYRPSCSTNTTSPSCSTSLPGPSTSTSMPGPSYSTSMSSPSYSTSLPDLSRIFLPDHILSLFYDDLNDAILTKDKELQIHLLASFYDKLFLNDFDEKENSELNQDIKISNIENCDYTQHYLLENTNFKNTDEEPEIENTECFVEDPDIVNPDIMYNINLNEYYNQLDLLALKVIKTPDDPTGLVEYKQLPPFPQPEETRKKFTTNERFRFANGISEWEYQIDRDDWNKIMVKRAVVFTAHAGFSIANEESLYVLADVAIDYVKKLAVIMKKHFDIQADSPCPDNIDPINNSLQEIGVKGGVKELIEHFENDVFGRRNKLVKKCQHLKKLIDRQVVNIIKTQNVIPEDMEEEYSTNDIEENFLSKEMDITEEEKTEIESGIEEVIVETQFPTDENIFTDSEIEQIDSLYVDNTDIEVKMDTGKKNFENIKIGSIDFKDRKINNSRTSDTSKVIEFDLLKPLDSVPIDYTKYGLPDEKEKLPEEKYSCDSKSYPNPPKSEKTLDLGTPKKVMKYLYSPVEVSPRVPPQVKPEISVEDGNYLGLSKMADQLDEDFNNYQASFIDDNVQTIYVHTISDTDDPISLNDDNVDNSADNSIQIIPVVNENDDSDSNIDYDIVSVHSFI
ncbi:uncharacterized protein LOC112597341 [Melanaphis sacchari]|uniref:uncharacterized protein LOC112597341 n=1 Tax=Melanaphis sacchari TaxID=742174 RepID=UPI000DC12F02|nr:uncharacterized protein LOC112597341 [Melanaphis sacchari]